MPQQTKKEFTTFNPRAYLNEYYDHVGVENIGLLQALVAIYAQIGKNDLRILEVGGGPTIYQLIAAAPHAASICFTDYLQANLDEINDWLTAEPTAFDWQLFFSKALECELGHEPTKQEVAERIRLLRSKISRLRQIDVKQKITLDTDYDVVSTHFVAESISASKQEWQEVMQNIISCSSAPYFVTSGLIGATYWQNGTEQYLAADIMVSDIASFLQDHGFRITYQKVIPAEHVVGDMPESQGYQGLFTLLAERKPTPASVVR